MLTCLAKVWSTSESSGVVHKSGTLRTTGLAAVWNHCNDDFSSPLQISRSPWCPSCPLLHCYRAKWNCYRAVPLHLMTWKAPLWALQWIWHSLVLQGNPAYWKVVGTHGDTSGCNRWVHLCTEMQRDLKKKSFPENLLPMHLFIWELCTGQHWA